MTRNISALAAHALVLAILLAIFGAISLRRDEAREQTKLPENWSIM